MKVLENAEKLLPLGYLFLVILGIIKESVFYYQIGINILKYSSIMDILISPIADLASRPFIILILFSFVLLLYLGIFLLSKNYKKVWVRKFTGIKKPLEELTEEGIKVHFQRILILMLANILISFFLGLGIGGGGKVAEKIAAKNIKYESSIAYNSSNEVKEIYLIGSNSLNYFYMEKGNNNIKITPVSSVKMIEFKKNN